MERLPYELRVRIFWPLPFQDRYTCLFVSKDWNNWVKPCFFSDLNISSSAKKLTDTVEYFDKHEEFSKYVQYVKISNCVNIYYYMFELDLLFPNLKKLILRTDNVDQEYDYRPRHCPNTRGVWKNLKEIVTTETLDQNVPTLIELILRRECPNVVEISTGLAEPRHDPFVKGVFDTIFCRLNSAPKLSKLILFSPYCTIHDFERLHANAPNLQSLTLFYTKIYMDGPDIIDNIQPVQLKSLDVHFWSSAVGEGQQHAILTAFRYISGKYIELNSLSMTAETTSSLFKQFDTNEIEHRIVSLLAHSPQLVLYDQMFCPISNTIMGAMDTYGIHIEEIKLYLDNDTLESQFDALFNSIQLRFLKRLSIIKFHEFSLFDMDRNPIPVEQLALDYVKQMKNLTDLTIQGNMLPICLSYLARYLNHLPQLTSFSFLNTYINPVDEYPDLTTTLNLKKIEIHELETTYIKGTGRINEVMKQLLPRCPDLEHFSLEVFIEYDGRSSVSDDTDWWAPFVIQLDFRTNTKLKTVDVRVTGTDDEYQYFFLVTEKQETTGDFKLDTNKNQFVCLDVMPPKVYYTMVVVEKPILLNSIKI